MDRSEIEFTLKELKLKYSYCAEFVKNKIGGFYMFDIYVQKPHKIVINLKSLTKDEIDFVSSCGFTVLDFSKNLNYDYYNLISSSLKKEDKKNKSKGKNKERSFSKKKDSFVAPKKEIVFNLNEKSDEEFVLIIPGVDNEYISPF